MLPPPSPLRTVGEFHDENGSPACADYGCCASHAADTTGTHPASDAERDEEFIARRKAIANLNGFGIWTGLGS